jgi:hypothetical protein
MFAFLMPLLGGLLSITGSLVGRVLLALGIGYATFKGFDVSVAWLLTQIKTNIGGMPVEVVSLLGYLWVDKAIGMIFSAYSAALLVKMAGQANVTKMVTKGA